MYNAGDQVIVFFACGSNPEDINPIIGWVSDKQSIQPDYVYVNTDLQQALWGYGVLINATRVRKYSESVWKSLQTITEIEKTASQLCRDARNAIRTGKAVMFDGNLRLVIDEEKNPESSDQHQSNNS